jgi:hypothetical protein
MAGASIPATSESETVIATEGPPDVETHRRYAPRTTLLKVKLPSAPTVDAALIEAGYVPGTPVTPKSRTLAPLAIAASVPDMRPLTLWPRVPKVIRSSRFAQLAARRLRRSSEPWIEAGFRKVGLTAGQAAA